MGNSSSQSQSDKSNLSKSPLVKRRSFIRFGNKKSKSDFSNILVDNSVKIDEKSADSNGANISKENVYFKKEGDFCTKQNQQVAVNEGNNEINTNTNLNEINSVINNKKNEEIQQKQYTDLLNQTTNTLKEDENKISTRVTNEIVTTTTKDVHISLVSDFDQNLLNQSVNILNENSDRPELNKKLNDNRISEEQVSVVSSDSWHTVNSLCKTLTDQTSGGIKDQHQHQQQFNVSKQKLNTSETGIVLRDHTTSSSSDSIFTDPLSPIGFAAELNQCYISEENICDNSDESVDYQSKSIYAALALRNYPRISSKLLKSKLNQLTISKLDVYSTSDIEEECENDIMFSKRNVNKVSPAILVDINTSNGFSNSHTEHNESDKGIFNISRIKKVELPEIISKTNFESKLCDSNSGTPTPQGTPIVSHKENGQQGNVLKKVANFTVENRNNSEYKIIRPTFVPEKLNFSAYEKFEGQMLLNWISTSLQVTSLNLNENDLNLLSLQYCTNLLVLGILKQIPDKLAPTQQIFKPNLMYQWTHTSTPPATPITPGKLDTCKAWPHLTDNQSTALNKKTSSMDKINLINQLSESILNTSEYTIFEQKPNEEDVKKELFLYDDETIKKNRLMSDVQIQSNENKEEKQFCDQTTQTIDIPYLIEREVEKKPENCGLLKRNSVGGEIGIPTRITFVSKKVELNDDEISLHLLQKSNTVGNIVEVPKITKNTKICINENIVNDRMEDEIEKEKSSSSSPASSIPLPPPPPVPELTAVTGGPLSLPVVSLSTSTPLINEPISLPVTVSAPPPPPPPPLPSNIPVPPPLPNIPVPPPPPNIPIPPPSLNIVPVPPPISSLNETKFSGPPPLPMPPAFNTMTLRKQAVNPPKPMKPLYWTRIVTQISPQSVPDVSDSLGKKELWQEIDEANLENLDEFTELFSRQAIVPKKKIEVIKPVKIKAVKVLDSKRSQNVGIFARSLHFDFNEIEHAIYHCDTSIVNLETLQHIMEIKATPDELKMIKEAANGDINLDNPEQFLLKISNISFFSERISCIVFQAEFDEQFTLVTRKLDTISHLCEYLIENEDLKKIFSIILTLGNYMNGGNRTRGQADGFGLEILGKLKDVKSKDPKVTLLHFIVSTYIKDCRRNVALPDIQMPIPDPLDVEKSMHVDFDECKQQLITLQTKINECQKVTEDVISKSNEENVKPFKDKMNSFFTDANERVEEKLKKVNECRDIFIRTILFYKYIPRTGTLNEITPQQFFELWITFVNDFRDIWKKEMIILSKQLMKKIQTKPKGEVKKEGRSTGRLKELFKRNEQQ